MIPLTFATEVALKQSLTEHILWSIWYLLLIVGATFVINNTRNKDGLGTIIIVSILTLLNILALIGHLASIKYFI